MSNVEIRNHPKLAEIYISGKAEKLKLYTKNLVPGIKTYGERLIDYNGIEYREWDPYRSKLASIILKKPTINFLSRNMNCLYLGASSGTTISHLSDIVETGVIYGVEFAERSMRQLIQNTTNRKNILPILQDARYPVSYAKSIFTNIDLIYQDIAQPNQAEIAAANCNYYLKDDGVLVLAIKSQSIDSVTKSEKIYAREKKILENSGYDVKEVLDIHNHAAKHIALIAVKK